MYLVTMAETTKRTKETKTTESTKPKTTKSVNNSKPVSNPKSKKESGISSKSMVYLNGIFTLVGLFLIIAVVLYIGLRIVDRDEGVNDRLDVIEAQISDLNSIPERTRNLLIYGDEQTNPDSPKSTSIESEPVLGDLGSATIAIVGYSDINCPFCQRFFNETLPQIEDEYIANNTVVFIHKDYPSVGGADSENVHAIAECFSQQKSDSEYYDYIKSLYATGESLNFDTALSIAVDEFDVDEGELRSCADSQETKREIQEDAQEATSLGFNGTPSFVIGRIIDGSIVEGEEVIGAQPYTVFRDAIENQRNQ